MNRIAILLVLALLLCGCSSVIGGADWLCNRVDDTGTLFATVGTKAGQTIDLALSTVCGLFRSLKGDFGGAWDGIRDSFRALAEISDSAAETATSQPSK